MWIAVGYERWMVTTTVRVIVERGEHERERERNGF